MSFRAGQVIGGYEILEAIGAGGMGSVFKVRNLISNRLEALKILLPDARVSPELVERFVNEIRVLASLQHPHIAALHTALEVDNRLLMIMELVEGATLEDLMSAGPVGLDRAVLWMSQVLSALGYAHTRGVVHRDIKPGNIAICSTGAKLLDFGIARAASHRKLTLTGMVMGSLHYMSPEQVNGKPADARSDLYSLGATLYRLSTGRRPFDGAGEFELMQAQVNQTPPPPSQCNPSIPDGLSAAIMRALAKDPADRFQTAQEFECALMDAGCNRPVGHSSANFRAAALDAIQKRLAEWLGPIAGALVRKHSRTSATLSDLCRELADQIDNDSHRRAFLDACVRELGEPAEGSPAARYPAAPVTGCGTKWDPAELEQARRTLAAFAGPLAKVMVDRASRQARDVAELYSRLAVEIDSETDRRRFLASRSTS